MYYYPCTTNKGKTYCVIGPKSEISALVSMIKQDVNDYLSSTLCECYMKHDCFTVDPITPPSMSPTNNRTSVTTTTIMTAATPEHQFYPMQYGEWRVCTTAKHYPTDVNLFPISEYMVMAYDWSLGWNKYSNFNKPYGLSNTPTCDYYTASLTSRVATAITFPWAPILFCSPWELKVWYHY